MLPITPNQTSSGMSVIKVIDSQLVIMGLLPADTHVMPPVIAIGSFGGGDLAQTGLTEKRWHVKQTVWGRACVSII